MSRQLVAIREGISDRPHATYPVLPAALLSSVAQCTLAGSAPFPLQLPTRARKSRVAPETHRFVGPALICHELGCGSAGAFGAAASHVPSPAVGAARSGSLRGRLYARVGHDRVGGTSLLELPGGLPQWRAVGLDSSCRRRGVHSRIRKRDTCLYSHDVPLMHFSRMPWKFRGMP